MTSRSEKSKSGKHLATTSFKSKAKSKSTSGTGKSKSSVKPKPVAKIPSSRAESSSNWKVLLLNQGKKPRQSRPMDRVDLVLNEEGSPRQSRPDRANLRGAVAVINTKSSKTLKAVLPEGLNEFGYFDYNHYGHLRTTITEAHKEFMCDTPIIAMDCEMVGVGPMKESALARVSIVNESGFCLYDRFVEPKMKVTDYRTEFSGIRETDLKNAIPFNVVTKEVAEILKGRILVGHSLKSDLGVLFLNHPRAKIRDTAAYFKKYLHTKTPKLKTVVSKLLGVEIQQGEHSSITDAQATMALYQLTQRDWEISVKQSNRGIDILRQTLDEFYNR